MLLTLDLDLRQDLDLDLGEAREGLTIHMVR